MTTRALHPPPRLRPASAFAELALWLVGFPFLLALAIWDASWSETARLILNAVVAAVYLFMFRPREGTR